MRPRKPYLVVFYVFHVAKYSYSLVLDLDIGNILTADLSSEALAKEEASCPPKRAARRRMAKVVSTFSTPTRLSRPF